MEPLALWMDRDEVMVVRTELCDRLKKAAVLDSDDPALEWVIATGEKSNSAATSPFTPALARDNPFSHIDIPAHPHAHVSHKLFVGSLLGLFVTSLASLHDQI